MPDLHPDYLAFNEAGKALQALGVGCQLGIRYADELVPIDQWMVALDCPGVPFGKVHGLGETPGQALTTAIVTRDWQLALQARNSA